MNQDLFLLKLAKRGLVKRAKYINLDLIKDYRERLNEEFEVISSLGYSNYFLIVWDIVRYAKSKGILVGPSRGSVGGSLLAYLIGITDLDPIKHDLIFERFMNPVRSQIDPPDIDLDVESGRREEIKAYIRSKYGDSRVCDVGTYGHMFASSAIKDMAKQLGIPFQEVNAVVSHKLYDISLDEAYETILEFKKWIDSKPLHQKCFKLARSLEGIVRNSSVHAAGIVITPGDCVDYIPTMRTKTGGVSTQWSKDYLVQAGILKIDLLGLVALDRIRNTLSLIDVEIDLLALPLDDYEVLDTFTAGETLSVFQFDTYHLQKIMKQLEADTFRDLVAATTIARPASIKVGIHDSYIARKHGREKIDYPLDCLKDVLSETMGHPIFQEQIMKMCNVASGGTMAPVDAEIVRDAMKKKTDTRIVKYREIFINGSINNMGASNEQAEKMWDMIEASSGYGYNNAHATAYSILSFQSAFLKHYYPLEWMTSCLKFETKTEKQKSLIGESKRLGLEIMPVSLNKSDVTFSAMGGKIYSGFTALKGVGDKAAVNIVENQPYFDREDFLERVTKRTVNKRVMKVLDAVGIFGDSIDYREYFQMYGGSHILTDFDLNLDGDLPVCEMCDLCENRFTVVLGDGNPDALIMFIGEAPGFEEDRNGIPFIGKSGRVLRENWIPRLGLVSAEVYITNSVKCIPLESNGVLGKPTEVHQDICNIWLDMEIKRVKPKIIVALGTYALRVISSERGITRVNGKTFPIITSGGSYPNIVGFGLFHPAYILREKKRDKLDIVPALKTLKGLIDELDYTD